MEVVWSTSARADLGDIRAYIGARNPDASKRVAAAIKAAGDSLGEFPEKGHLGEEGTREWVVPQFPNYLLIYDVSRADRAIIILRVWHQARNR